MSVQTPKKFSFFAQKLLNNLIRGIILIAPIGFTISTTLWLFNTVDSFLPNLIQSFLDYFSNGKIHPPYIPGLGLIVVIVLLAFIGYVSRFFIFNKLLVMLDQYFEKAPGLKFIYTTFKDLMQNLSGSKKKFNQPVLIETENHTMYKMGFITKEDVSELGLEGYIAVYVPMSFSIAGSVYFVPKDKVRMITDLEASGAMKFLLSGGVTNIQTHQKASLDK